MKTDLKTQYTRSRAPVTTTTTTTGNSDRYPFMPLTSAIQVSTHAQTTQDGGPKSVPVTTAAARNDRPVNGAVQTIAASSELNDWSDLPHRNSCVPLMSTDDEYSSQMEDYGDYGDKPPR